MITTVPNLHPLLTEALAQNKMILEMNRIIIEKMTQPPILIPSEAGKPGEIYYTEK